MNKNNNIFREWVPRWLALIITGCILIISLLSFALYYSNMKSTIGYYGFGQADVQFSVVIMYATVVTFLALDSRLIKYFAARRYITGGLIVNIISYIICFYTKDWFVFMACRFVQGISCALLCSAVMHLSFSLFRPSEARKYGYSLFYGGLQISIPVCAIYCTQTLRFLEFKHVFSLLCLFTLLMQLIVTLTMNKHGRFYRKFPLYQTDWKGGILYTVFCILAGYILVYARQFNGFGSMRFTALVALTGVALCLLIAHEMKTKRPLINLRLFRYKGFIASLLLLAAFYIFKGTIIFVYNYAETVLHVETENMIPLWCINIAGVCTGTYLTARYLTKKFSLHTIITGGFSLLGLFHLIICFILSSRAEITDLYLPVYIYGLGTSTLFVPLVLFAVSSVPANLIPAVAPLGIFARFTGFCISICLNSYYHTFAKSPALAKCRAYIADGYYLLDESLNQIRSFCNEIIYSSEYAATHTDINFNKSVSDQLFIHSSINYFGLIFMTIAGFVLLLMMTTLTKRVVLRIRR